MDRQIKAERAWEIPYKVSQEIGGFDFDKLSRLSLAQIKDIFKKNRLHRFNDKISECFYLAIQKIKADYHGDASKIWDDYPASAAVVRRFLEFKGVGVKIATMAANILVRYFKVPMKDHLCIDISPDVHIKRVFIRLGFIPKDASNEEVIYCARELNPEYPGIFDLSCWEIGRNWCRPTNPVCNECYLNSYCQKVI
jgi:endonuclease III